MSNPAYTPEYEAMSTMIILACCTLLSYPIHCAITRPLARAIGLIN